MGFVSGTEAAANMGSFVVIKSEDLHESSEEAYQAEFQEKQQDNTREAELQKEIEDLKQKNAQYESNYTEDAQEDIDEPPTEIPPVSNPKDLFGETIAASFEENGINWPALHDRFWKYGQLEDSDFNDLQKAGLSRKVVEPWLAGLKAQHQPSQRQTPSQRQPQPQSDGKYTESELTEIFNEVGGKSEVDKLSEYATNNWTQAKINEFDQDLKSGVRAAKLAFRALKSEYKASLGREGISFTKGGVAKDGPFSSQTELTEALNDPRYRRDAAYRAKVDRRIGATY